MLQTDIDCCTRVYKQVTMTSKNLFNNGDDNPNVVSSSIDSIDKNLTFINNPQMYFLPPGYVPPTKENYPNWLIYHKRNSYSLENPYGYHCQTISLVRRMGRLPLTCQEESKYRKRDIM